jgi:hypothetical protein
MQTSQLYFFESQIKQERYLFELMYYECDLNENRVFANVIKLG